MYSKSLQITFFITLFSIINCFAQTSPSAESEKWTRIDTAEQELSLAFPPKYIVDAEKKKFGAIYKITGFSNGVIMELSVSKNTSGREFSMVKPPKGMNSATFSKKNLNGIRSSSDSSQTGQKETISIFGDKNYYFISITAADKTKSEAEIERFLYSIKIKGENLFKNPKTQNYPEESVALSSLGSSPEVTEAIKRKLEKRKFKAEKIISSNADQIDSYAEYSRPPIIVEQQYPQFRPRFDAINSEIYLSAKLKLTLSADGQISDIKVVGGSDNAYIDSCIDAAKKIRFIPAQKNGVNADSFKTIEFNMQAFTTAPMIIRGNAPGNAPPVILQ